MKNNIFIKSTDQFSYNKIGIEFSVLYTIEDYTKLNFLAKLLERSTKRLATNRLFKIALEDLYDARISTGLRVEGNYLSLAINITYLKALEDNTVRDVLAILKEVIFMPNVTNKKWNSKDFKYVTNSIQNDIDTEIDEPLKYGLHLALMDLDKASSIAVSEYGDKEIFNAITSSNIYDYYQEIISKDYNLYGVGIFSQQNIGDIEDLFGKNNQVQNYDYIYKTQVGDKPKETSKTMDLTQAVLVIGYEIKDYSRFERLYVSSVFNDLFGGSYAFGKLYAKVRKERGLVYNIRSTNWGLNGVVIVRAGTSLVAVNEVSELVEISLDELKEGQFDENYIDQIKQVHLSHLTSIEDNLGLFYSTHRRYVKNLADDIETMKKSINQVTKHDIINYANKLNKVSTFVLAGDK